MDEVIGNAVAAGGGGVKAAAVAPWGYFGYFSDPDGNLRKVASALASGALIPNVR